MKKCLALPLVAAVAALASAPAFSAQQSWTLLTPFAPVPGTSMGTLPQFNPALGTLTGVQFSWAPQSKVEFTISHPQTEAGSATWDNIGATSEITLANQVIFLSKLFGPQGFVWPANETQGCQNGLCTIAANILFQDSTTNSINQANWSLFEGTGTVGFEIDNLLVSEGFASTGASTVAVTATFVEAFGTLTYDYRPAPEPGSLALLALAGSALAFTRRRRRA